MHHSHVTGEQLGYTHDFCNLRVKENNIEIPANAHNLFGFDLHYFIKGYVASSWCSKELKIGRSNLTHIYFSNIAGEIKFINTLKYYQKSLAELASTLSDEEKTAVKNLVEQFFNQHYYFNTVWPFLNTNQKEKILEIVSEGKGVIPYELIISMESFFLTPEKDFWDKTGFFSKLKQRVVNDKEYENSLYLYKSLKMRNLGDMNDLYNAQDVILLTEIIENRFQIMYTKYGFNPRKCNSASTLSGCIERQMSRIILALPTKLEHFEILEQTMTDGFSSVNTRLAFDTQILLPNLNVNDEKTDNPLNKDFNYKVVYNLKLDGKKSEKKKVITKILKLDENNQYGNGMTKPIPTGCIKDHQDISSETFNCLLEKVLGHLYIVDIEFDVKNATK